MRSSIRKALFAASAALVFALAGLFTSSQKADAQKLPDCEKNLCSFDSGNCFPTDLAQWNCKETGGGCSMSPCGES